MKNQVNLRPALLQSPISSKESKFYIAIVAVAVLAIATWGLVDFSKYQEKVSELKTAQDNTVKLTQQLESLSGGDVATATSIQQLDQQLIEYQAMINKRQGLVAAMNEQASKAETGFFQLLRLLSNQHNEALYLTQIHFRQTDSQRDVLLKGVAKQAQTIPLYIQGLRSDALVDTQFNHLQIEQANQHYQFTMATQGLAQ